MCIRDSLEAGKRSMGVAAFEPAAHYFRRGIKSMERVSDAWSAHRSLQMELHLHLAEVAPVIGAADEGESAVREANKHATSKQERLRGYRALMELLEAQSKVKEAFDIGWQQLRRDGLVPGGFVLPKALIFFFRTNIRPVSYTHLTLPTIYSV